MAKTGTGCRLMRVIWFNPDGLPDIRAARHSDNFLFIYVKYNFKPINLIKMKNLMWVFIAAVVMSAFSGFSQNSLNGFAGMWTIEIEDGAVGWLNVHNENGYLDAELLWRGGSVVPVSDVYFIGKKNLVVTRTREVVRSKADEPERKHTVTQVFNFKKSGTKITGTLIEPNSDSSGISKTKFKGWKLPDVPPAPDLQKKEFGESEELFNGRDLSGWKLIDPKQVNGFRVMNGMLVNDPVQEEGQRLHYGNIRTEKEYEDFNLKLEVNVPEHSNSGIYLRGMYEIQVADTYGKELDSHNMGGLYSRIAPVVAAEKPAGEWQSLDITLCDRHVTVNLNGKTIIENQPVYGPTGGAIIADVFKSGPIYLQGDHGKVSYRNIILTPIIK